MKKILLALFACMLAFAACQTLDPDDTPSNPDDNKKEEPEVPAKPPVNLDITVGICHCNYSTKGKAAFEKCLYDAGAKKIIWFQHYVDGQAIADDYIYQVDALVAPGEFSGDVADGRASSDDFLINTAIAEGKPVLGICYGHQRINKCLGGNILKIADKYPDSQVAHRVKDGSENVGLYTEAHWITINKKSNLYKYLGNVEKIKVNTSHDYCTYKIGPSLDVTATADDGVVEAIEGKRIMGVQFHPEHLYGTMQLPAFLGIFEWLIVEAKAAKEENAKK